MQCSNAYDEMILIFDGIEVSLISRANRILSNSLLFGLYMPNKNLSSLNIQIDHLMVKF